LPRHRELIQFINLHQFDRMVDGLLDDEDIRLVQAVLQNKPHAGTVVQGGSGLRKLRIALPGRGKRGGARLLYLYIEIRGAIYFIAVFAKSRREDITPEGYQHLHRLVQQLKEEV
jgi:hypothetical protein